MGILNVVENIKEVHKEEIVFIKIGNFYHVYGRDSYIISYLFGYRLIIIENKVPSCGFPEKSFNRILAKIEEKNINYIALDRRNNYETDLSCDNKNLNTYDNYYQKAKKYINYKKRIDEITNFLTENVEREDFKDILRKMEEIINERRKV